MKNKLKDQILEHLGKYKGKTLEVHELGVCRGKEYAHILPKEQKYKNLINSDYWDAMREKINEDKVKLHQFFHHLNSSQALTINFFVPIIVEDKFHYIFSALDVGKEIVKNNKLEKVIKSNEFTNFDFFLEGELNNYFFEVKYTEDRFTSRKIKDSTSDKYNRLYEERLKRLAPCITKEDFFKQYQLWRNLIYATEGIVVFVFPRFREDLEKAVLSAKKEMKFHQENVKILYLDDICSEIIKDGDEKLIKHYTEFQKKYKLNII